MTLLFIRGIYVTLGPGGIRVGDQIEHNLKIAIDIEATISGSPNTANIDIWNLNRDHRNSVGKEWDEIMVEAGYREHPGGQGNVATIFKGFIRDVHHERDNKTSIKTHIECGDGDKAIRGDAKTKGGIISKTMTKGTKPKDMVLELHKHMPDVDLGDLKGLDNLPATKRPTVLYGPVFREMNKLSRSHGFYWSIQCGVLETIPFDGAIEEEVLVTPYTGLLDTPTLTDTGIKFRVLNNPMIKPNRIVRVESEALEMNRGESSARYRVDKATHRGDNGDGESPGEFATYVEGTEIQ